MKHCLQIREYNLAELGHEGRLISNENSLLESSKKGKKQEELGFANFKIDNTPDYSIVEMNNLFYEDVRIGAYNSEPVLSMNFMMEGMIEFEFSNKNIIANGGRNNIWSLNSGNFGYSTFKKNVYCSGLAIYINANFLKELINKYPELLEEAYKRCISGETFCLNPQYRFTTLEMTHIISQIRNAKLMGRSHRMYSEAKILELLSLQLKDSKELQIENGITHCKKAKDIEKIHEARRLLVSDLNQSLSIKQLSRQVGINENKLKYGFKELFNHTIFGYLFDYKMDLACQLLLDTKMNIIDIANQCGYEHASHFSTAFKRKFRVTPQEFRNKA